MNSRDCLETTKSHDGRHRLCHCGACGQVFMVSLLIHHDLARCEQCVLVPITRKDADEKFELSDISKPSTRIRTVCDRPVQSNGLEVRDKVFERHL